MLIKISLIISGLYLTIFASFDTEIESLAGKMAESLKLPPVSPLCMTTIDEDKSYMLSMAPVYKVLKGKLAPYIKERR